MTERGTFKGEVVIAWQRLREQSWKVKGVVVGVVVLLGLGLIGAVATTPGEVVEEVPPPASQDREERATQSTDPPATRTARATSTPEPTRTPSNTPTPRPPTATPTPAPPTPTPVPAGYAFGSGTKIVGSEVIAGATYRTRAGSSSSCYWERLSGFGGTIGEIEANDNTTGPAVVTIGAADVGFNSQRCGTWTQDLSPITADPGAPFKGDGTYIVGVDIAPGTWRATGGTSCYWQRMRSFSGELRDIIANDNVTGDAVVTIGANDAGFSSQRCGTWTKIQ